MEYDIRKGELSVNETAINAKAEEPIDIDITLPDYCPDIQRILKCQIKPVVHVRAINQDRLDIEGDVKLKLLYLDEDKKILRCFDYKSPFSISMGLKDRNEEMINPVISTKSHVEYVNCRAVSPRRLNISGAFCVKAKITYKAFKSIACEVEDQSIEQKNQKLEVSEILSQAEKTFSINEILEIADGKPTIGNIIRSSVTPIIYESRAIANKIVLKGEALISILYRADIEENDIQNMEYSVPISQILDIDGVDDGSKCRVSVSLEDCEIEPGTDSTGEDTLIECEIKMTAVVIAYKDENINMISDVYSKEYELETQYKNMSVSKLLDGIKVNTEFTEDIDFKDRSVSKICCVYNDVHQVSASVKDDDMHFKGKYNVCIIAMDENDELMYIEKMMDFHYVHRLEERIDDLQIEADIQVTGITFRIRSASQLEIKAGICITADLSRNHSVKCLDSISADETSRREKDETASIVLYYAQKGESVWDIAMRYASSVQAIKEENDIDTDVLSTEKMLLIPV